MEVQGDDFYIFKWIRNKVSADKNRFREQSYDLDLSYITDRIIAMSFPSNGIESAYRNHIDKVSRMLVEKHQLNFMVYNLSERSYDTSKFKKQVNNWCGFPDHSPPPFNLLLKTIISIDEWLRDKTENIAVLHCLAGKGRTGTIIACYFVYCGLFDRAEYALNYFATKRSINNWGVTGPAQLRYIYYFEDVIFKRIVPKSQPLVVTKIQFNFIPPYKITLLEGSEGICPQFDLVEFTYGHRNTLFTRTFGTDGRVIYSSQKTCEFKIDRVVCGDILVTFNHVTALYGIEKMFHFAFHTGMVDSQMQLEFSKSELEVACKNELYPYTFKVTVCFSLAPDGRGTEKKYKEIEELEQNLLTKLFENQKNDPTICFHCDPEQCGPLIELTHDQGDPTKGSIAEKGGYMSILTQNRKWKRKWFVLKSRKNTLTYCRNPRDLIPEGLVQLTSINKVEAVDGEVTGRENCLELDTGKGVIHLQGESPKEKEQWLSALQHALTIATQFTQMPSPSPSSTTLSSPTMMSPATAPVSSSISQ